MGIAGIATAIPLPVDLFWPMWICGRLQSCSDKGRSQMAMRYANLAPEHQASAVDRLVPDGSRMGTRSATGKSGASSRK